MKPFLLLFTLLFVFFVYVYLYQRVFRNKGSVSIPIASPQCNSLIFHLNTTVPILLIDPILLEKIENGQCSDWQIYSKPIKIGVYVKYLSEHHLLEDSRFEVLFFTNDSKKDYLDFRTEPRRIIPKRFATHWVAQVEVPSNISIFMGFWKRSKFVDCMNLYIPRNDTSVYLEPIRSTQALANLCDELIDGGMFPYLNGGTLLGWYRECSVIPHTSDMDVAVSAENFNPEFVETLDTNYSKFDLRRKFGMLNDSFQLTVSPREGYRVFIDIFLMYKDVENGTDINYVGVLAPDGTKYKYTYPVYDPWCSADLHGHIFWVTCTPKEKLVKEYGPLWYRDHLSKYYSWKSSGKNVRRNGNFSKEQMKGVYYIY